MNQTLKIATLRYAQSEGLLTDPIYTTKLFYTAEQLIIDKKVSGNILIIHSGGGTGLLGFAEKFAPYFT